jgi:ATP-dependent protease HslVU (ClpYQ) ATPase subunit
VDDGFHERRDAAYVRGRLESILQDQDLSRYIL